MNCLLPFIMERNDVQPLEFYYKETVRLKKLQGFDSGRHFLPKYYSKALETFVGQISQKDIQDQMENSVERIREILGCRVNDFSYDVSLADGGIFESEDLRYQVSYKPDRDNLAEVWLEVSVVIKSYEAVAKYPWYDILKQIPFPLSGVKIAFASPLDLRGFIEQFENAYPGKSENLDYQYDSSVSRLDINLPESGKEMTIDSESLTINFTSTFGVNEFLSMIGAE